MVAALALVIIGRTDQPVFKRLFIVGAIAAPVLYLVVLATHGRDGVAHWLHGSVAEAVFRRSAIPTLFIAPGARGFVDQVSGECLHVRPLLRPERGSVRLRPGGAKACLRAAKAEIAFPPPCRSRVSRAGPTDVLLCTDLHAGNVLAAEYFRVPLTTVRQPRQDIGAAGVDMLVGMLEGRRNVAREIVLPHELVIRASTAQPHS